MDWHIDIPILGVYNTESPVPRSEKRRFEGTKNVGIGLGGVGLGYAGLKVGQAAKEWRHAAPAVAKAAEDWGRSSPVGIGRAIKSKGRGILQSAMIKAHKVTHFKQMLNLQSRLREIRFGWGDAVLARPPLAGSHQHAFPWMVARTVHANRLKKALQLVKRPAKSGDIEAALKLIRNPRVSEDPGLNAAQKGRIADLLRRHNLSARLKEIRLATGDYARKYLINEPLLAQKGQEGYDPGVEREVKAALTHKRAPELSEKGQRRVSKVIQGEATTLKSGYAKTETPLSGKRFMPMVKIVKPYKEVRKGISAQKAATTKPPKPGEPPPTEFLPAQKGKKGARGSSTEVGDTGEFWDYKEAGKPTNIKYIYPERQHAHLRTPPTAHEVSVKGQALRDPIASHLARVEAGIQPNMIQTREGKIPTGLSKTYLPKAFDVEERRKAQLIRDTLAHKLRALRSETIFPMRDIRRKYLGLSKRKLSETGKQQLWARSEAMGNLEIAPGYTPEKPRINPMVPILPNYGVLSPLKPIAEREVHPRVIHAANQKLRAAINDRTIFHQAAADSIRQGIHDRLQERHAKTQSTKLLRETSKRLTNETFSPSRVGSDLEAWEAENLAHDTGTSPEYIRAQHRAFTKHTHLTTGKGEEKLRRAMNLSLFKGIAGAPEEPIKRTYPIFKSIGKKVGIGAGIAGALGLGAYAAHKLMRRKETQFAVPVSGGKAFRNIQNKLKGRLGHEIAIGTALTGGITAADAATSAIFPAHGQTRKQAAWEGTKRGAIYGSVLSGVEPLIRIPLSRKLHTLSSKVKEIQFQKWATLRFEDPDIPSPWNKKRRLTVAQDRYRKVIREREIQRHEANLGKSALAGAALGGLLHHRIGTKFVPSLAIGAAGGLAAQTAAMIHGRSTKDPYGEASIAGKRIERLPYQAGAVAAGGLAAHELYKRIKKFSANGRLIRFQQFIPAPDQTPWYEKQARGFLRHPRGRVENVAKWAGRAKRAAQDIRLPKTETGEIIDPRGRTRQAEWQKPYVKRALYTTGAISALAGVSLLGKHFYHKGKIGTELLASGKAGMKDLSSAERFGLNVTSGNWWRAAKKGLSEKFPKAASGMQKLGGLRSEFRQAKEGVYDRLNKAIEGKVGAITGAELRPGGIVINNPAKIAEEAARDAAEKERLKARISQITRKHEARIKKSTTRGALEKILKPPEEKLSSKLKLIQFQDYEPGYVKVKPHYRHPRSPEPPTHRRKFREGVLIGTTIAGTGLGTAGGFLWHATRQTAEQKIQKEVAKRLAEIAAKKVGPAGLKILSSRIDNIIQFKEELSKAEQKRRKGEKGSDRSRILDALTAGSVGGGLGGGIGAATGLGEPPKKGGAGGAPKPKWYDPFKRFRPGGSEEEAGLTSYGETLGMLPPEDMRTSGEYWKTPEGHEHVSTAGAFQKGPVTKAELESRRALQKGFARSKRITKRGAIGAAIGATTLAAPFLLKKPYPKGGGRETEGKKLGTGLGMQAGLLAGGALGIASRHPIGAVAGLGTGLIIGSRIGQRIGGGIGSRIKRREKRSRTTTALSARLDDIISLK